MTDTDQQPISNPTPEPAIPILPPNENEESQNRGSSISEPATKVGEEIGTISPAPQPQPTEPPISSPPIVIPPTGSASPQQTSPASTGSGQARPKLFLAKALESLRFRKKAKLEKIMKLANEKKSVTNDQVQKLLRVSDATATRYLSELVRQNRLKRVGTGTNTRYEPLG